MKLSTGLIIKHIPDLSHLNDEQKQRCRDWIAALRSGKYPQIQSTLKTKDGFCCLGVGCDLAAKSGVGRWEISRATFSTFKVSGSSETYEANLPPAIQSYYGMPNSWGLYLKVTDLEGDSKDLGLNLAHLNDDYQVPFSDIALIIETALNGGLSQATP